MALTQIEKAEKYDKKVAKERITKLQMQALMLRAIEGGTMALTVTSLGALHAAKPELDDVFHGLLSPKVIALLSGGFLFAFAGKSETAREAGAGVALGGLAPLLYQGGEKLYNKAIGAG